MVIDRMKRSTPWPVADQDGKRSSFDTAGLLADTNKASQLAFPRLDTVAAVVPGAGHARMAAVVSVEGHARLAMIDMVAPLPAIDAMDVIDAMDAMDVH